jgi:hypothetical protein
MSTKIPLPIVIFGALLSAFGFLMAASEFLGLRGLLGVDSVAPGFTFDSADNRLLAGMFAARVFAMAGVLAVGLILRDPLVLAVGFAMRMATEALDATYMLGTAAVPMPTRAANVGVVLVLIVLEGICLWRLWHLARARVLAG